MANIATTGAVGFQFANEMIWAQCVFFYTLEFQNLSDRVTTIYGISSVQSPEQPSDLSTFILKILEQFPCVFPAFIGFGR